MGPQNLDNLQFSIRTLATLKVFGPDTPAGVTYCSFRLQFLSIYVKMSKLVRVWIMPRMVGPSGRAGFTRL